MATVYAVHDVRHGRRVVLKVLHPELTEIGRAISGRPPSMPAADLRPRSTR